MASQHLSTLFLDMFGISGEMAVMRPDYLETLKVEGAFSSSHLIEEMSNNEYCT
jgi:hypothetical protein